MLCEYISVNNMQLIPQWVPKITVELGASYHLVTWLVLQSTWDSSLQHPWQGCYKQIYQTHAMMYSTSLSVLISNYVRVSIVTYSTFLKKDSLFNYLTLFCKDLFLF